MFAANVLPLANARGPLAAGACACLVALAYDPNAPAADPKRWGLLVLGVFGALAAAMGSRPSPVPSRVEVLGALFVAWSVVSIAWGTRSGFVDAAPWVGAIGIVLFFRQTRAFGAAFFENATCTLCTVLAVIALVEANLFGTSWVHGLQGNPDWLGLVLALGVPCFVARIAERRIFVLGLLLVVVALAFAHARGGAIAAMAGAIGVIVPRRAASEANDRPALSAAAVASGFHDHPWLQSLAAREWLFRCSYDVGFVHFPFGAGLGRFHEAFLGAQSARLAALPIALQESTYLNATTSHSDISQAWAETGLVGALLLVGFLLALILHAHRTSRAAFGTSLALAAAVVLDMPLRQPTCVLVLALLVGSMGSARGAARATLSPHVGAPHFAGVIVAASALLLGLSSRTWFAHHLVRNAEDHADRVMAAPALLRIETWDPSVSFLLATQSLSLGDLEAADRYASRANTWRPDLGSFLLLGNISMARGNFERARIAFEHALAIHPASFRAHASLASAFAALGRRDPARDHAKRAVFLRPGSSKAREQLDAIDLFETF